MQEVSDVQCCGDTPHTPCIHTVDTDTRTLAHITEIKNPIISHGWIVKIDRYFIAACGTVDTCTLIGQICPGGESICNEDILYRGIALRKLDTPTVCYNHRCTLALDILPFLSLDGIRECLDQERASRLHLHTDICRAGL